MCGATAPSGCWPPSEDAPILLCLLLVSSILELDRLLFIIPLRGIAEVFLASAFIWGEVASRPTSNLEDQGIPFRLVHHL